jgi:hypothetical protein
MTPMELFHANQQWSTRPADERFASLDAMYDATKAYATDAREKEVAWADLRVEAVGTELALVGKADVPAKLSHYAFGQLASRVEAPASYLRKLPATLAAQNLNHGFKEKTAGNALLLFHHNEGLLLRAATSEKYARVWNHEVVGRLLGLRDQYDLDAAHQTFKWDGTAMTAEEKTTADRALYASDHDMFAFLMSQGKVVQDPVGQPLHRGIIVTNSEVGDRSLGVMSFWFRDVCENHIIWGAEQLAEIRLNHVGDIKTRWNEATVEIRKYLDKSASFEQAKFEALTVKIGATKEEVLDAVFNKRSLGLSRKAAEASYDAVVPEQDGDPRTKWGFAQGLTRYSQQQPYADERYTLDRAAGKVLSIDF